MSDMNDFLQKILLKNGGWLNKNKLNEMRELVEMCVHTYIVGQGEKALNGKQKKFWKKFLILQDMAKDIKMETDVEEDQFNNSFWDFLCDPERAKIACTYFNIKYKI